MANFGAYLFYVQDYYEKKYNCVDKEFQNSNCAWNQGLVLPLYLRLKENKIDYMVDKIKKGIRK